MLSSSAPPPFFCSRLAPQTTGGCVYGICRRANVLKKSPGGVLSHLSAAWCADYRCYSLGFFLGGGGVTDRCGSPAGLSCPCLESLVDTLFLCAQGQYVIASSAEGGLHVWTWDTGIEICHIAAHKQRIHHCSLLPNRGKCCVSICTIE